MSLVFNLLWRVKLIALGLLRRRTFHEPNLIRIKTEPNYLDGLN